MQGLARYCLTLVLLVVGHTVSAQTTLTVEQARDRAVQQNRVYLQAQEDLIKANSRVTTAKAEVLPDLSISGQYNRNFRVPSFFVQADTQTIEFTAGFKNEFGASLNLEQNLFDIKAFQAVSIARLYNQYSESQADAVRATVIYTADILFYSVLLCESRLEVIRKEYEAAEMNLGVAEKKYEQGIVSEFEVLRARVEKANLEPRLIQAESAARVSRKELNSFLVYDLSQEFVLMSNPDDTSISTLPLLSALIDTALLSRPEMREAQLLTKITRKAIGVSRAGYFPTLSAVSNISWQSQSDDFTLRENDFTAWSAGVRLQLPIFDGFRTRGEVSNSRADYNQQALAEADLRDKIRLEVEQTYDRLLQAHRTLQIQGKTIAQAEKGMQIANVRYESGVGTLLEVLSAQAALTEARNAQDEALFFFRDARAQLTKATTVVVTKDKSNAK